jgi:hypothetical protein
LIQKRQFFAEFFGENVLKIITSVPGRTAWNAQIFVRNDLLLKRYKNTPLRATYNRIKLCIFKNPFTILQIHLQFYDYQASLNHRANVSVLVS